MEEIDLNIEEGNIEEYVEEKLFSDAIDTLNLHVERKKAVADRLRYSVLYLLYKHDKLPREELVQATGKESNALHHHLRELLNNNLIAEVPTSAEEDGRKSYYRITKLGAQEIEADIQNIASAESEKLKYKGIPVIEATSPAEDSTADRRAQNLPGGVDINNSNQQTGSDELHDTPERGLSP
jgi:DNA-binding transcriptional ArsR family regulator